MAESPLTSDFPKPPGGSRSLLARHGVGGGGGAACVTAVGVLLVCASFAGGLRRLSLDWLFGLRPLPPPPTEAVIVALDEQSHQALNQPFGCPWDRALHAQLLQRLREAGAKAVVFDIIFSDPDTQHLQVDQQFAAAMKAHGKVVLGGEVVSKLDDRGGIALEQNSPPLELFISSAAAWADVGLPQEPDNVIRHHLPTDKEPYSLAWATAKVLGLPVTTAGEGPNGVRYLNYYGPPGTIPVVSYNQALEPKGVAEGYFKDKVVFVGQQLQTSLGGAKKDEFATPFTRVSQGRLSSGMEIHATAFLNLAGREWLTPLSERLELALVVLMGLVLGGGGVLVRPKLAVVMAVVLAGLTFLTAWLLFRYRLVWLTWTVLMVQISLALAWSILSNSLRLYVEKQLLQQEKEFLQKSMELHLSEARVLQLLADPDALKPGGYQQEVSIMFTDIEDFSRRAGKMQPADLFPILNEYYEVALNCCVEEHDGMVVQIIGDAIYAIWNAPLKQPDHQARACLAAVRMQRELARFDAEQGKIPLRTRFGIHSGVATVGNLGSKKRFDYACIGSDVNLASRLEGLNKYLNTSVLASRTVQQHAPASIVCRGLGFFIFKGSKEAVDVQELLGEGPEWAEKTKQWRKSFEDGLNLFRRQRFEEAAAQFQQTIQLRREAELASATDRHHGDGDGPSLFYLEEIEKLKKHPPSKEWDGEVELGKK